jgi:biotin operon repressor
MDVIKELADKWKSLSSMNQSSLIEALGGKYRGNAVTALLENFSMYESMLKDYSNASGSAMKENEKRMNSWQAKANQLANSVNEFWNNTIDTDLIKGFIDSLNKVIQVLDVLVNNSFSSFVIKVALTTGAIAALGIGLNALKASYIGTAVGVVALEIAEKGLIATTKALTATMLASPLFWVALGATAIFGIANFIDAVTTSIEEQKQKVEDLSKQYDELKSKISGLEDDLKTTGKRIDELNSKDKLSIVEKDELEKLKLTNKELLARNTLLKQQAEITSEKLGSEALKLYNKMTPEFSRENIEGIKQTELPWQVIYNKGFSKDTQNINILIAAYEKLINLKKESTDPKDTQKYSDLLTNVKDKIVNQNSALSDVRDKLRQLPNPTKEQKNAIDEINESLMRTQSLLDPKQLFTDTWSNLTEEQKKYVSQLAKNGQLTESQIKQYKDLFDLIKYGGFTFEDLRKSILNVNSAQKENVDSSGAFKSIVEDEEAFKKIIDDLNKDISSSINTIQSLNTAIKELDSKEGMSSKTLEDLITNYPELIMYMDDETKLRNELTKLLTNETENQKQLFKSKLEYSTQYFNQMIKGNADVWNVVSQAYGKDAKNFQTIADIKSKINDKLVKYIGKSWSDLYDNEIEALSSIEYGLTTGLSQVHDDVTRNAMLQQLKDVQKQKEILQSINKPLELTVDKIDFGKLNEPKEKKEKKETEINKIAIDQFAKLQEAIDRTNNSIENNKKLLSNTDDDKEKIKILEKLISLYKEQQKQLHNITEARRNAIEKNIDTLEAKGFEITYDRNTNDLRIANEDKINKIYGKDNEETNKIRKNIEDIINQTKDWNKNNIESGSEWQNLAGYIKGANNDISDIYKKQAEDAKKAREEAEKLREEQKKLYEDSNKTVVDLLKKRYEQEKKIKEQAHKDTIDGLDKELDAYKKYTDGRLEELDRLYATEDYNKDVTDKSKDILDIQKDIDKYTIAANQGDLESIAKIKELNEQKLKLNDELQNTQRDREKELRKQNLQDNLSDFEEFINKKKEAENKSFEEYNNQLEKATSDTTLALEAEKLLMTGTVTDVKNSLIQLFTDVGENVTTLGKIIQDELISKIAQLQDIGAGLGFKNLGNIDLMSLIKANNSAVTNATKSFMPSSVSSIINNYITNKSVPVASSLSGGLSMGDINISVAGNATPAGASKLAGDVVSKMKDMMIQKGIIKR